MYELSQIILWILWTLRPAMAVETNLVDILNEAMRLFEDEDSRLWMEDDPANCALVSQALLDARSKLDLLIYLRACEIADLPHRARMWRPVKLLHHSDRDLAACWRRFGGLAARFDDAERLAQLRAAKLLRERDELPPSLRAVSPFCLDASHRSTFPSLRPGQDIAQRLEVLHRQRRGRWIATSSSRDGRGRTHARGPPEFALDCPLPTADCLAA